MFELPPVPAPEGLHPLVGHFLIALLFTAPVFMVLGFLLPRGVSFRVAALILMVLGTVGILAAISTGEDAEEIAEAVAAAQKTVGSHEAMAKTSRTVFLVLTGLYFVVAFGPRLVGKQLKFGARVLLHTAFLAGYLLGCMQLARTAHEGGRIVHEHGVRAWAPAEPE